MHRFVQSVKRILDCEPPLAATQACRREVDYAVEARGLRIVYGRKPVLYNLDLQIKDGEAVAVMGPNGAGKSTLLSCLVGALRPTAGSLRWFGEVSRNIAVRRQIGFAGHEPALYGELSAIENLLFAGRMYGVEDVHEHVENFLAGANLLSHAHRPVDQLSQGMRQRVSILRTLVHQPRMIVLDEPSSRLDAEGQMWLNQLLAGWRQSGRTVCFASHNSDQCRELADRIIHLSAGHLVEEEQLNEVASTMIRSA